MVARTVPPRRTATVDDLARAQERASIIRERVASGESRGSISRRLHLVRDAVDRVLDAGGDLRGPDEERGRRDEARERPQVEVPHGALGESGDSAALSSLRPEPGGFSAAGEDLPPSPGFVPPITGAPPGWPTPSPLGGEYARPDLYETLRQVCIEFGLSDRLSRGVVRQFSHLSPSDYSGLDAILMAAGTPAAARRSIVSAWKLETGEPGVFRPTAQGSDSEDDMVEVILNVAGFPVKKRVKLNDLPQYAAWLPKPNDPAATASGASAREKELEAEVSRLREAATETRHKQEMRDLEQRLGSQIAGLKVNLSGDQIKLEAQREATTSVLRNVDRRLSETGSVQKLVQRVADSPALAQTAEKLVQKIVQEPQDLNSRPGQVSEEELMRQAAALEAARGALVDDSPIPSEEIPPARPSLNEKPPLPVGVRPALPRRPGDFN